MAVSKEQWEEIEKQLGGIWGRVELVCDGYKINAAIVNVSPLKLGIAVYVDGVTQGKWVFNDEKSEIPLKFHQEKKRHVFMREVSRHTAQAIQVQGVHERRKSKDAGRCHGDPLALDAVLDQRQGLLPPHPQDLHLHRDREDRILTMSRRPNRYPSQFAERKREIQLIKIAQKELGMDEDSYRAMLWAVARVKSSTELDWAGRKKVLDHMKACGWKPKTKENEWKFIETAAEDKQPLLRKICAVCRDMKVGKAYAEGTARRQHGIERKLEMMDVSELYQLAGALERTRQHRKEQGK